MHSPVPTAVAERQARVGGTQSLYELRGWLCQSEWQYTMSEWHRRQSRSGLSIVRADSMPVWLHRATAQVQTPLQCWRDQCALDDRRRRCEPPMATSATARAAPGRRCGMPGASFLAAVNASTRARNDSRSNGGIAPEAVNCRRRDRPCGHPRTYPSDFTDHLTSLPFPLRASGPGSPPSRA